ncbi:hypothetical protein CS0771_36250 [Catellatospora sp. IY07-71]|uniref:hypothetical protein n=1 Tax=Catellatospora sp. IY07-71 TaxID=2728827 RepID=UPI001BB42EC0|nr:hypothetical protein [Catellatospora sp. IY07-71]BCJ74081.1 hypothetical protein CS0771_36250 [Catellatospora sp. IY07-71]
MTRIDDVPRPWGRLPRQAWPPVLVLLAGPVVLTLVLLDVPGVVRAAPVLAYLAVVPGAACVRLVRLPDRSLGLLLGVGLSLALALLVSQAMVYLRLWSPLRGLAALVAVASLAACAELLRSVRPAPGRAS